jgi:hypothetical protein
MTLAFVAPNGLCALIAPMSSAAGDVAAATFICGVMTLALIYFTFYVPSRIEEAPEKTRLMYLRERKEIVYDNLRDLNFEYKAGKYPEADYEQMRASLEDEAATVLAEIEVLEKTTAQSATASGRTLRDLLSRKTKGVQA